MEKRCPRCGAVWEPDLAPDVETVILEEATGAVFLVVGSEHECDKITEWS
ncbi:MAG TPA: hypothetical protein VEO96_08555 [Thermoplasmata archaeon]|nr:hypothetical protein [Thermoplasmata archaeon]